ncbi:conserved hypothetical protein [Aeromonas veronii]|uniref:Uncharacterized protein n=1 Tax=Aeromonas veronii TaxID=654 RepID=A0A653L135_AERVE|nr:conserved hypothetical protein [Aeromonas veronii]
MIGLQHRHGAEPVGLAALANGGDALPRLPDAIVDLALQAVGQLLVKGHDLDQLL